MRYEVQKQVEEIDKALGTITLYQIPNMDVSKEKLEGALKKAESCMRLMMYTLTKRDITMKELNEQNHRINKQPNTEMNWKAIEDYLFDRYCVEGEDRELSALFKKHDEEVRAQTINGLTQKIREREEKLFGIMQSSEPDTGLYKETRAKHVELLHLMEEPGIRLDIKNKEAVDRLKRAYLEDDVSIVDWLDSVKGNKSDPLYRDFHSLSDEDVTKILVWAGSDDWICKNGEIIEDPNYEEEEIALD